MGAWSYIMADDCFPIGHYLCLRNLRVGVFYVAFLFVIDFVVEVDISRTSRSTRISR